MSFAKVYSAQTLFLKANIVNIEVDISNGLHSFSIVGLGDKAIDEAKDRITAAIKNTGYTSPKSKNQKVVVSLAPADVRKEGSVFDVGMAIGYLLASKEISFDPAHKLFIGELSLDGKVQKINGILPIVSHAKDAGFADIFIPEENVREASIIKDINIYGIKNLRSVIDHVSKNHELHPAPQTTIHQSEPTQTFDFSEIKGQESAKRGLEIAASGGHNIAMFGPPGTGKTMLAKAFSGILPQLSFKEIIETTSIHSSAGILKDELIINPPFRSPHHTSSYISIIGGGAHPKPGEITFAHRGVLFMDEFPEFDRRVIDSLRQPLEDRTINIARAKGSVLFPSNFILICAMNLCPCGNFGNDSKACICPPLTILKYQQKISGPIIDRIDIWIEVSKIDYKQLTDRFVFNETSKHIRDRVTKARLMQHKRFSGRNIHLNSEMTSKDTESYIPLTTEAKSLLDKAALNLNLSARSYYKILKLSRTIADMASCESLNSEHILEALQYRRKFRMDS